MIQINLQPDVEARLSAEAAAHGVDLEHYIVERLSSTSAGDKPPLTKSLAEAIAEIKVLRKKSHLRGLGIKELIHEGR